MPPVLPPAADVVEWTVSVKDLMMTVYYGSLATLATAAGEANPHAEMRRYVTSAHPILRAAATEVSPDLTTVANLITLNNECRRGIVSKADGLVPNPLGAVLVPNPLGAVLVPIGLVAAYTAAAVNGMIPGIGTEEENEDRKKHALRYLSGVVHDALDRHDISRIVPEGYIYEIYNIGVDIANDKIEKARQKRNGV